MCFALIGYMGRDVQHTCDAGQQSGKAVRQEGGLQWRLTGRPEMINTSYALCRWLPLRGCTHNAFRSTSSPRT